MTQRMVLLQDLLAHIAFPGAKTHLLSRVLELRCVSLMQEYFVKPKSVRSSELQVNLQDEYQQNQGQQEITTLMPPPQRGCLVILTGPVEIVEWSGVKDSQHSKSILTA